MTRLNYIFAIVFLLVQVISAQNLPVSSLPTEQAVTIEFPSTGVEVYNAFTINSSGYEFSPSYYKEGIVYVSTQPEKTRGQSSDTPFFELYYAILNQDGMPSQSSPFSSKVNTRRHEGQATFNQAGDLIYYTGNSEMKNDRGQYAMKIYEARKKGKDWNHIVDLPFNSEAYSNRHPSISANGKYLYFASDMPGGYGGTDIYVVEKQGTQWGIPVNLGDEINTPENDAFPFIHDSEYLFFSSKGHGGQGDYDIFVVNISGGLPGPVMHLNNAFNSPKADIGFILNEEGTKGFFASDRAEGFGNDDIYLFETATGLFGKKEDISEKITTTPVSEVVVSSPIVEDLNVIHPAELIVEEAVVATPPIEIPNEPVIQEELIIQEIVQEVEAEKEEEVVSTEIIQRVEEKEIDTPAIVNCSTLKGQALSQNGAPIAQGNVTIRSSKGAMPLTLETNKDGNFEVCLPFDCQYIITVEKNGYQMKDRLITIVKEPVTEERLHLNIHYSPSVTSLLTTHLEDQLNVGSVIELNPIYYNLESGTVNTNSTVELDALAQLMRKYRSIEIELIDHTDARGDDYYNQQLSQTRISIAKNYLVKKGQIVPRRINAIAMGEQQIRNHCTNNTPCEDEAHQYNRRTEVRIIRIVEAEQVWFDGGKL